LSILARDEDEICVISCDEEDGDPRHGEGSCQVHDSLSGFHACATNAEDDVAFFRYLDLSGAFFGQFGNEWCEDILRPSSVADDGALGGRYADVEEAVLVVEGETFEENFWTVLVCWVAMGEKDSKDWLEKRGVEVKGDVYKAELTLLFAAVSGGHDGRFDVDIREHK
jgi:hypothetical protein